MVTVTSGRTSARAASPLSGHKARQRARRVGASLAAPAPATSPRACWSPWSGQRLSLALVARPAGPPLANVGVRRQPRHGYSHPKPPDPSAPGDSHAPPYSYFGRSNPIRSPSPPGHRPHACGSAPDCTTPHHERARFHHVWHPPASPCARRVTLLPTTCNQSPETHRPRAAINGREHHGRRSGPSRRARHHGRA
jgi:hypothetical protein